MLPVLYAFGKTLTIPRNPSSPVDPQTLALGALGWLLESEDRARRLLDLTGLTPEDLRFGLGDPAVLDFLAAHEPDLVSAAEALGVAPGQLVEASERLVR